MNHFPSNDRISAYVDDRLSREERAEVEALLQSSDEARAELESYRQLRATLQALPTEAAPSDLLTRIMAQAEQESLHGKPVAPVLSVGAKGNFWKRWTIPSVSVAASVALLLLIMFQFQSPQVFTNSATESELVSQRRDYDTDAGEPATEMTGTTFADSESAIMDDRLREIEPERIATDGLRLLPDSNANGTFNMLSAYDIGTAEIGGVIDALQVQDDRVVVVQLTVVDRQRVLDGLHVLLSKVNVPQETPETNNYGSRTNDLLAVYVEAGEGELAALLSDLQENMKQMDVEQMLVSTSIPSDTLNQYAAEQGYKELFARNINEKQAGSTRRATPPQAATKESLVTEQPVAEAGGRGRPVNDRRFKDENSKKDLSSGVEAEKNLGAFGGSLTKSKLPPPPPLPQEYKRSELIARSKPAPFEPAPPEAPTPTPEALSFESHDQPGQRYVQMRLPEYVGKQLIQQQESVGQLSLSNGDASKRDRSEFSRKMQRENLSPASAAGADLKRAADKPDAAKPGEAAEADEKGILLLDQEQRNNVRPLRVLIVLTDDPARPAEAAAQPSQPEAKQKAKD